MPSPILGRTDTLAPLALVLAMLLWASSFIALKFAFRSYDPLVVIFGRMLVASICFLSSPTRYRMLHYRRGDYKLTPVHGSVRALPLFHL